MLSGPDVITTIIAGLAVAIVPMMDKKAEITSQQFTKMWEEAQAQANYMVKTGDTSTINDVIAAHAPAAAAQGLHIPNFETIVGSAILQQLAPALSEVAEF